MPPHHFLLVELGGHTPNDSAAPSASGRSHLGVVVPRPWSAGESRNRLMNAGVDAQSVVMWTGACDQPPGFHTTTRELQTCTFEGPGTSNTTKIPREDPQEREERMKIVAGEGKKREMLGPPFEAHPSGLHFSGFGAPPFGAPPPFGNPTLAHTNCDYDNYDNYNYSDYN